MSDSAKPVNLSPEVLQRLLGSVHTFESFGRAIVADALAQAAKATATESKGPIAATVKIVPLGSSTTFSAASQAGHVGKAGEVPDNPVFALCVCITGGDCHFVSF